MMTLGRDDDDDDDDNDDDDDDVDDDNDHVVEMGSVSAMTLGRVPARRLQWARSAPPALEDTSVSPSRAGRAAPR